MYVLVISVWYSGEQMLTRDTKSRYRGYELLEEMELIIGQMQKGASQGPFNFHPNIYHKNLNTDSCHFQIRNNQLFTTVLHDC